MESSRRSLAIAATLSLLTLCSGCTTTQRPAAILPPGPSVAHPTSTYTIPPGASVVPSGTKHFAGVP
jgi:hypothetical protein